MPGSGDPYIIHVEACEPEVLWCDACLLPSRLRITFVVISETGITDSLLPPADRCTGCGKQWTEPARCRSPEDWERAIDEWAARKRQYDEADSRHAEG